MSKCIHGLEQAYCYYCNKEKSKRLDNSKWVFPEYPNDWERRAESVKKRNGYKCQRCGATGVALHAHHIISKSRGGSDDLSNLMTLCEKCHAEEHPHMQATAQRAAMSNNRGCCSGCIWLIIALAIIGYIIENPAVLYAILAIAVVLFLLIYILGSRRDVGA